MFGYVMANRAALTQQQQDRFRGFYCGLCHQLHARHGLRGQVTLSFEMAFVLMTLSALYEAQETCAQERCLVRPYKKHAYILNEFSDYAADLNLALAYHKCMDDWLDERKLVARGAAGLLQGGYRRALERWPDKCRAIEARLAQLRDLEQRREGGVDAPANCFGALLGELFVYRDDPWAEPLRAMGEYLGRFVYVLDAYDDLEKDQRRGAYNPLRELCAGEGFEQSVQDWLTMLIGRCTQAFEVLPIIQDAAILRNVLYAGVWTKYYAICRRRAGGEDKSGRGSRKGEKP